MDDNGSSNAQSTVSKQKKFVKKDGKIIIQDSKKFNSIHTKKIGHVYLAGKNVFQNFITSHQFEAFSASANCKLRIVQVAASNNHVMLLTDLGKVYGLGNNECGQLGVANKQERHVTSAVASRLPKTAAPIVQIACMENASLALDAKNTVYYTGNVDNKAKYKFGSHSCWFSVEHVQQLHHVHASSVILLLTDKRYSIASRQYRRVAHVDAENVCKVVAPISNYPYCFFLTSKYCFMVFTLFSIWRSIPDCKL